MTKAEIIESVLLRISGGRLSADIDVHRNDIANILGAAIGEMIHQYENEKFRRDRAYLQQMGIRPSEIAGQFSTTYTVTPLPDNNRKLYYVELSDGILPLPGNAGIDMLSPKQGRTAYVRVSSQSELAGIEDCVPVTFYWVEQDKIYIDGLSQPVCDHILKAMVDPAKASNETEMNLPDGIEFRVIDLLVAHFTGQSTVLQDITYTDTHERGQNTVSRAR